MASFSADITSDLDDVFFQTDEWAETVTWTDVSASSTSSIPAIRTVRPGREQVLGLGYRSAEEVQFRVKSADVSGITLHDTITDAASVIYAVAGIGEIVAGTRVLTCTRQD